MPVRFSRARSPSDVLLVRALFKLRLAGVGIAH